MSKLIELLDELGIGVSDQTTAELTKIVNSEIEARESKFLKDTHTLSYQYVQKADDLEWDFPTVKLTEGASIFQKFRKYTLYKPYFTIIEDLHGYSLKINLSIGDCTVQDSTAFNALDRVKHYEYKELYSEYKEYYDDLVKLVMLAKLAKSELESKIPKNVTGDIYLN